MWTPWLTRPMGKCELIPEILLNLRNPETYFDAKSIDGQLA